MERISRFLRNVDLVNTVVRYNPVFVHRVRNSAKNFARASAAERRSMRSHLLSRTLAWATGTDYGRYYGDSLAAWPILDKDLIRKAPRDFLRARYLKVRAGTGGTTGTPLQLFRSLENIAVERFFIEQLLTEYEVDLCRSRVAILRADEVKDPGDHDAPFGVYTNSGRTLVLSNSHLSKKSLPWFAEELKRFRPSVLNVYPSMLENLLALLEESSEYIEIPIVLSSSEMVNGALFERVSRQLGGQLIDYYGQGERVAFAFAKDKDTYFFDPVYGNVELIPEVNAPDGSGYRNYRVIASGHWNSAMPLVRYDTGDFAMVKDEDVGSLAKIASGELPFLGIKGRNSEFVLGPDGEVVSGLNHLPRNVPHLLRMQIVQESPISVLLRVSVEDEFSVSDELALMENARALLPSAMTIVIQRNATLERGKNGKIPFVIRNLSQ